MTKIVEDVAHLSEHIGPRPAGTEEEQQAALYIASELQQGAGFSAVIEDFSCLSSATIVRTICFAAGFIAALLLLFFPALALPACILGIIAAVIYVLEATGKEVISRFFHTGISQNVVAQYKPAQNVNAARSRKVILVANYDSTKEDKKFQSPLTNILGKLRLAVFAGLVASPVILLIHTVFFTNTVGGIVVFLNILTVICLILMALPLIDIVILHFAAYNQAANNNASGVGVLLETARTIGNGLVDSDDLEAKAHEEGAVVHGKEAAQSAGVVPEGVEVEYEAAQHDASPEESLAAAKAAIAALTGKPVADKVPITDISSRLVKAGEPADTEAANVHFEVETIAAQQPVTSGLAPSRVSVRENAPQDVRGESGQQHMQAAAQTQEAAQGGSSVVASAAASQVAAAQAQAPGSSLTPGSSVQASQPAVAAAQVQGSQESPASFTRETPQALQSGQTGMATNIDKTPAWAKSAQAKAHANKPNLEENKKVSRSRFADAPAAHMADASAQINQAHAGVAAYSAATEGAAIGGAVAANSVEGAHETTPQKPMTELEARLAALHSEIAATEVPHLSDDAKAAFERMGEQEQQEQQKVQEQQEQRQEQQRQRAQAQQTQQEQQKAVDDQDDQGKTQPQQRIVVEADTPSNDALSKASQEVVPAQQEQPQNQQPKAKATPVVTIENDANKAHQVNEPNKVNEIHETSEAAPSASSPVVATASIAQDTKVANTAKSSISVVDDKTDDTKTKEGKTQAIAPIDVSALLNKEAKEPKETEEQQEPQIASKPDKEQTSELVPVEAELALQSVEEKVAPKPQSKSQPKSRAKAEQDAKQQSAQAIQIMKPANAAQTVQPANAAQTTKEPDVAAAPIVGMDSISPLQSAQIPTIGISQEHKRASQRDRQVIVLPDVVNAPSAPAEVTQQRAPMAEVNESAAQGSKALLSNILPRIDEDLSEANTSDDSYVSGPDTFGLDLPALDDSNTVEHNTVSPTGSFSTIGGTGAFAPVGDDLVADIDPEEIYVDDADDSAYDQEFTQTGAFAGAGYVEMPKSRAGRLFGRFRSKKNKRQAEPSMSEWIDADETYNARSVGKERGSWESFREDDEREVVSTSDDAQFIDVDYSDNSFNKFRDWNGGAFSLDRLRRGIASQHEEDLDDEASEVDGEAGFEVRSTGEGNHFATSVATASSAQTFNEAAQINQELKKLKQFRYPGIDTEIWFVALGAENAGHSGMQAFINEHESELKGALFVDLEALGTGRLSLIEKEGLVKPKTISSRIKRIVRAASEKSGVPVASVSIENRDTTARYAAARGYQALTLMGMEQGQAAFYGSKDDTIDNIDQQTLEQNVSFVMAILKSI